MSDNLKKSDKVVFWGMCLGYLFLGLVLLSAYSRVRVLPRKYVNPNTMSYWYQLRWNVYTRKIDEPMFHLYTIENNKARLWDLRPFTSQYMFGLNRHYKLIAQEIMVITNDTAAIKTMKTYKITVPAGKGINDCIGLDTLQFNEAVHPNSVLLKGRYLIVSEASRDWNKDRLKKSTGKDLVVLPVNISRR